MKRIILLTAISLSFVFSAYAQRGERTDAYLALQKGKLKEAKEAIDKAVKNEKTMNDAKTWLYYGEIYYGISTSPLPVFRNMDPQAPQKALAALEKAKKLDEKHRISKEADEYIGKLSAVFYSNGANDFKVKDYNKAITDFEQAYKIAGLMGKTDTTAAYNVGISGVLANQPKVATEYLKKCIDLQFKDPKVYIFYSRSLKQMGDTTAAMQALDQGKARFPKELSILLEQAQIYLEQGKSAQLIASLKEAIARDPNSPSDANFYFLIGKSYDDAGNKTTAEEYYKKAIGVNGNFFEAYYNIGAIFVNNASTIQKQANNLPLDKVKEYNALNDSANAQLKLSLPWLEKALSIRPGDKLSTTALKEAYTRLKMYDKLKALNANK